MGAQSREHRVAEGIDPRADDYAGVLRGHLHGEFGRFVDFFSNPSRLKVLARLLARHLRGSRGTVLNVGCGPFATEFFVEQLRSHRIVSFDYTPEFAAIYPALRSRGYLDHTEFFLGDAMTAEFEPESFDLILMHDLLYEPALDWQRMFHKYDCYLRRGGLLFFTLLDSRTGPLWRLLGREQPRRRYSIPGVVEAVRAAGYQVLECVPCALDSPAPLNRAFKHVLWRGFGLANEYAILARKAL